VAETIKENNPQVIVVNAGAAQFLHGDPITMTAGDVVRVCRAAAHAKVIAVHMEAIIIACSRGQSWRIGARRGRET